MTVLVVDYGSGNLRSAAKALEHASREAGSAARVVVSDDPRAVAGADRIVLPGVGAFADCKAGLEALPGMIEALEAAVVDGGRPFLGICVGMQLLATRGLEHGVTPGLGWIPGEVVALAQEDASGQPLDIPHMGWNDLAWRGTPHPLLAGLEAGSHMYFVHGYYFVPENPAPVVATVAYGQEIAAMVARDNIAGTQFHPEKSQRAGLRLLANFLGWQPQG